MAEMRFDGMVALITGSASGIGRNHAMELARRGASVMINDIAKGDDGLPGAETFARMLVAQGYSACASTASVAEEAGARGLVQRTVERFGRIDLLVNNAGSTTEVTTNELATDDLRQMIETHLFGSFWCLQEALVHMRRQDFGRVVNTSSALGCFGAPNSAAYTIAKAALLGLTRAAMLDNRDKDIRVNSLAPVAVTPLSASYFAKVLPHIDQARLDAANVTPAVLYLLSRECPLNGETIAVGGGRIARIFTATAAGYRPGELETEQIPGHLEEIMSTEGFEILKSSMEQYRFL